MGWICKECGGVNTENSSRCDCGYELTDKETKKYSHDPGQSKTNRKKGCLAVFVLFILAISFLFYAGCTINLPAIKGAVFYEETNAPVEGAYVVCFYYKYPLIEAINVGGANKDYNYVEVVKTDQNGQFKLSPYRIISLAADDTRYFVIYKPGCSVLSYYHASASLFIDLNDYPWTPKVPVKEKFFLPKEFDNKNNRIFSVVGGIERFMSYFKYEDENNYRKNLEIFREIYRHINNETSNVKAMLETEYARESWDKDMKDLRYYLGIEETKGSEL